MGIFSFFKNLFSKDIVFKSDKRSSLVFVHKGKKGRIWLDKNIDVPENMEFYFAKNGKVLDGFISGEHEIVPMYLSKTIKTLKLNKKAKNGKIANYFFADGYFINLLQDEVKNWKLFTKVEVFDEKIGYFKIMLEGKYIVKIANAKRFLRKLLLVYDYLRPGEAEDILEGFISETVFKSLMKKNPNISFLQNKELLTDFLFESVTKSFEKSGVEILGFSVEKVEISKKVQRKINQAELKENQTDEINKKIKVLNEKIEKSNEKPLFENEKFILDKEINLKENQEELEIESNKDFLKTLEKTDEIEIKEINTEFEKRESARKKLLLPPLEKVIIKSEKLNFESQESKHFKIDNKQESLYNEIYTENDEINEKNHKTNQENHDKNNKIAKETSTKIKCQVCGEENNKESKSCVLCGQKL